jgi:hypothetical protein
MTWAKILLFAAVSASGFAQNLAGSGEVEAVYPQANALYFDLHQNLSSFFMKRRLLQSSDH